MFAAKSTLGLLFFAVSARLAFAAPPACLLAAVNTESHPADLPTLCGKDSSKVQDQIKGLCGDNVEAALDAYRDICKAAGKPISTESSSSKSSSSHASKTSSSSSETTSGSTTKSKTSTSASETSAPYPVTYTSAVSSSGVIGSSGFVIATGGTASTGFAAPSGSSGAGSGSGSGSSATGSPILPSGTKAPGSSSTSSSFTGSASKNVATFGAGILAVVGLALVM